MYNTLIALYEETATAREVLWELKVNGFDPARMSLIAHDSVKMHALADPAISSAEGRDFGAFVGGLTGLVVSLVTITVPGIGPIIAAGPLTALLGGATGTIIGAGAGALTGGLSAALVKLNVPPERADRFAEGVLKGNVLVVVEVTAANADQAARIMSSRLPLDIQYREGEQAAEWRAQLETQTASPELQETRDIEDIHRLIRANDPQKTEPRKPRS